MFNLDITNETLVRDIVGQDFRTASIFFRYGIDSCWGDNAFLQTASEIRGLNQKSTKKELIEHNAKVFIHIAPI